MGGSLLGEYLRQILGTWIVCSFTRQGHGKARLLIIVAGVFFPFRANLRFITPITLLPVECGIKSAPQWSGSRQKERRELSRNPGGCTKRVIRFEPHGSFGRIRKPCFMLPGLCSAGNFYLTSYMSSACLAQLLVIKRDGMHDEKLICPMKTACVPIYLLHRKRSQLWLNVLLLIDHCIYE